MLMWAKQKEISKTLKKMQEYQKVMIASILQKKNLNT